MLKKYGIIMPIFSLPSEFGIGTLGENAFAFVDFLEAAGQNYWQVLPIEPTAYGDSPYQSPASFAGNPYFIDFKLLVKDGLLDCIDIAEIKFPEDSLINYEYLFNFNIKLLKKTYQRKHLFEREFQNFKIDNELWLNDYALYVSIKENQEQKPFFQWPDALKFKMKSAIINFLETNYELVESHKFIQFIFFKQWSNLKNYANSKGIKIIGDLPIYVAHDSADLWSNKELFQLDKNLMPTNVAGCPPDDFSYLGQLWGNPLYEWKIHKETGYNWWINRLKKKSNYYDELRIDHFRGFSSYYSIPINSENAINGKWKKGPGFALFKHINLAMSDFPIIAEDLGLIDAKVRTLLKKTKYPGMKVLQFGLLDNKSEHNPENIFGNYIVYPGTHDNDTLYGWYQKLDKEQKEYLRLNYGNNEEVLNYQLIKRAYLCDVKAVIVMMQDFLILDSQARLNMPATKASNWQFRFAKKQLSLVLAEKIKALQPK
ncbi:MAG: 4-alpha-glucanotransferase [Erysipelotrichales bacterium]|nr:4-alpha-glucanotransferase [Erysipelotrichales bacterium]